jgi:hypothetical protein
LRHESFPPLSDQHKKTIQLAVMDLVLTAIGERQTVDRLVCEKKSMVSHDVPKILVRD